MNFIFKYITSVVSGLFVLLVTGCGSADKVISDVVDNIKTRHKAQITYVNASENMASFYIKSTVNPLSVYDDKFFVTSLRENSFSEFVTHSWIDGAFEAEFAAFDTNTEQNRTNFKRNLSADTDYFALLWFGTTGHQISVIERKPAVSPSVYTLRLFTASPVQIFDKTTDELTISTKAGEASEHIQIDGCDDLKAQQFDINLCATGTPGRAYLVVINQQGEILVLEE